MLVASLSQPDPKRLGHRTALFDTMASGREEHFLLKQGCSDPAGFTIGGSDQQCVQGQVPRASEGIE